jgi:hypothetical protein
MPSPLDYLNRLLALQYRSLPRYLAYGEPYKRARDQEAKTVVAAIAKNQEAHAQRLADLIMHRGGIANPGEFPLEFAERLNFLSLEYLLTEMIHYQKQDLADIETCVVALETLDDFEAHALAEEVLGAERGHLEMLLGLVKEQVKALA